MEIIQGSRKRALHCCLLAAWLFLAAGDACAQSTIRYLPRNEDMDSKERNYTLSPITLSERSCGTDVFQLAADCYTCIQDWIPNCPGCCIDFSTTPPKLWCKDEAEDCQPGGKLGNFKDCEGRTCASIIGRPEGAGSTCVSSGGSWYCDRDNLEPSQTCFDRIKSSLSECAAVGDFFETEKITNMTDCPIVPSPAECYKYTRTDQLRDCIAQCNSNSANCNALDACKADHCGPDRYDARCGSPQCLERIAHPQCRAGISEGICASLTNDAMDCLAGSGCSTCFREIDSRFFYRFIPKSRESFTILWEISSEPQVSPTQTTVPPYFFYTKVQVFDERSPASPVHESVIHQKYLGAAFSIFCATHIDKDALKPGRAYRARLYYYLPDDNNNAVDLKILIRNLRFISIRIRE